MMNDSDKMLNNENQESRQFLESEESFVHKIEYVCPYPGCNETFYRKNNLTNHFKAHVFLI